MTPSSQRESRDEGRTIALTLLDETAGDAPRTWRFSPGDPIQIGRAPDNDVVVAHKKVSRFHSTVFHDGTNWEYANLGHNGSFLDGQRVEHVILRDGAVIQLYDSGPRIRFELDIAESQPDGWESDAPVTVWLDELKAGEPSAATKLWEQYFERIVVLARRRLGNTARRAADEEDVAVSVFKSFFEGVEEGRFPELEDRTNLWRLLVTMTARKAINQIHHERRQKRGGGAVRGESVMWSPNNTGSMAGGFERLMGEDPTPEFVALLSEETQRLLDDLGDETLCSIALWKMEGYTNDEIAEMLDCTTRTVERKMRQIRERWSVAAEEAGLR